jgi:diguanylate cyclase
MMQVFGIRLRLFLAAGLPAVLAIIALLQGFLSHYDRTLQQTMQEHAAGQARQLAASAEFPLFARNLAALQHLAVGSRHTDSHVAAISILAPDRRLLVADGPAMNPARVAALVPGRPVQVGQRMMALAEIRSTVLEDFGMAEAAEPDFMNDQRRLLGYALVEVELSALQQQRQELLNWALVVTASSLLVAGLLSVAIASSVTRPLAHISAAVARLREGMLGARVDARSTGVLRPLAEGINAMAQRLAEHEAELQQRVQQATEELRRQKEAAERASGGVRSGPAPGPAPCPPACCARSASRAGSGIEHVLFDQRVKALQHGQRQLRQVHRVTGAALTAWATVSCASRKGTPFFTR